MKTTCLFIILSAVFVFSACENEIPLKVKNNSPKMILNALFEVERDTNYISLGLTGLDYVDLIDNAKIKIYVNNELKDEINKVSLLNYYYNDLKVYKTTLKFSPGDLVRIEAETPDGKYHAWAEDIVPELIGIENIDTTTYVEKDIWGEYAHLRIRTTFTDNPGKKNYYRLAITEHKTYHGLSIITEMDSVVVDEYPVELNIREDIVLNDGRPPLDNSSYPLPETKNQMNIFDDSRLNGSYTLNVSFRLDSWFSSPWNVEIKQLSRRIKVRLISITEAEFYYLRALNLYVSDNYDDILSQPIRYPSNVHGGIGIFGISFGTSQTIQLPDYILMENAPLALKNE
ncbi:MAG: DUF4249 domain-containing protein [Tannerella sp.]|jgi:hypothetical protein|nr:DUF4249 domain-containing protein [Tannerella sp.]